MLYRFAATEDISLPMGSPEPFVDQELISEWAADSIRAFRGAAIVVGRDDGSFDPQAHATRAEVATIFARFLDIFQQ